MDELFRTVDNQSGVSTTERVKPTDRSNKDKKKNGFSDLLKEKMKDKLDHEKEEDILILHEEVEDEEETNEDDKHEKQQDEAKEKSEETDSENSDDDSPSEHVDFNA